MPRGLDSRPMQRTPKARRGRPRLVSLCVVGILVVLVGERPARGQEPAAPQTISPAQLQAAIDKLGDLDYATRTTRLAHRPPDGGTAGRARPAAGRGRARRRLRAVSRARPADRLQRSADHRCDARVADEPQRPSAHGRVQVLRAQSRSAAWCPICWPPSTRSRRSSSGPPWCARSRRSAPTRGCSRLLAREAARGEDFFRSAVIEALGDYKAQYAFDAITAIAKLDGPLQDDAAWRSERSATSARSRRWPRFSAARRRFDSRRSPPAICLLDVNCASHEGYLIETLKFGDRNPGFQDLLRAAAAGLGALGAAGPSDGGRRAVRGRHPRRAIPRGRLSRLRSR